MRRRLTASLFLLAAHVACADPAAPARRLQSTFPSQAPQVLGRSEPGTRFQAVTRGGAAAFAQAAPRRGLSLEVPKDLKRPLRLSVSDGWSVLVREAGAGGTARPVDGAIEYTREGGTSWWVGTATGYEAWTLLDRAPAASVPALVWNIEGAVLRRAGAQVELLDKEGLPRIRIEAPVAYTKAGRRLTPSLDVEGNRLLVYVDAPGETVLIDPALYAAPPMAYQRGFGTATLLPTGKVLVAGGYTTQKSASTDTAELYDPATGSWSQTQNTMSTPRSMHVAILLTDGKVLIAGGSLTVATSELFDPVTETFSGVAALTVARERPTPVVLADGRPMLIGGSNAANAGLASTEIYDAGTNSWSPAAPMSTLRKGHLGILLPDNRVLVAGGQTDSTNGTALNTTELYVPSTNQWSNGPTMAARRIVPLGLRLASGKVLIAGGRGSTGFATNNSQLFDHTTNAFTATGNLPTSADGMTATLLPDGRVLATGGASALSLVGDISLYNPAGAGTWSKVGDLAVDRRGHKAVLLPSGSVLVTGGDEGVGTTAPGISSAEVYDPTNFGAWASGPSLVGPGRSQHTTTLLTDGRALLAGGNSGAPLNDALLFDPASNTWTAAGVPSLTVARRQHRATLLADGRVLVTGGDNASSSGLTSCELYQTSGTWAAGGSMASARYGHSATLLADGRVLVAGGRNDSALVGTLEGYWPSLNAWASAGTLRRPRRDHQATLLRDGRVLITGGEDSTSAGASALGDPEIWDPATNDSQLVAPGMTPRRTHWAVLLPNGRVMVGGGTDAAGNALVATEVYDPQANSWSAGPALVSGTTDTRAVLTATGRLVSFGVSPTAGRTTNVWQGATRAFADSGLLAADRAELASFYALNNTLHAVGGYSAVGGTHLSSTEIWTDGQSPLPAATPTLAPLPATTGPGQALALTGTLFQGIAPGSLGLSQGSPANFPLVVVQRRDNAALYYPRLVSFTATAANVVMPDPLPSGVYDVRVVVNGIPSQGRSIAVSAAPGPPGPAALGIETQPPATVSADTTFGVAIKIVDSGGATVLTSTEDVTLVLDASSPPGATLEGTTTVAAVGGVATFSNLRVRAAASGYRLRATSSGLVDAVTSAFAVIPGATTQLVFTTQPGDTTAGEPIGGAGGVVVTARDAHGNTATSFSGNVTVALGANPVGGALSGTTGVAASAGIATFTALTLDRAGSGYTLTASSGAFAQTSAAFDITPGAATQLVFTTPPSNTLAGASLGGGGGVVVTARDAQGNTATAFTATVTVGIGFNPAGGTLSGSAAVAASAGVATFPGLWINRAGTGYTLTATSGALTRTSAAFDIAPGPASALELSGVPATVRAGQSFNFAVTARDAYGNTAPTYARTVAFASSDPKAILPAPFAFTAQDAGTKSFTATLRTAGQQSVSLSDDGAPSLSAQQAGIQVVGPAQLRLTGLAAPITSGEPRSLLVEAVAPDGSVDTGYRGTVQVTSSDPAASLPADYTFTPADNGMHTFAAGVTLRTLGVQGLAVTDALLDLSATLSNLEVLERLGGTCGAGTQCGSGSCVDGVCCDSACAGPCEACDLAGGAGTCRAVPDGTSCANATYCDGSEVCQAGACSAGAPIACVDPAGEEPLACDEATDACQPVDDVAPTVVEDAILTAEHRIPYPYNAAQRVIAIGTRPLTFARCGGPAEFRVEPTTGEVTWMPAETGVFTLCVQASNAHGSDSYTFQVNVAVGPGIDPTAAFTATPPDGPAPLSVVADGTGSDAGPGSTLVAYRWSPAPGAPRLYGPTATVTYPVPGGYPLTLEVVAASGRTATAWQPVLVSNARGDVPTAARILASATRGADSLTVSFSCDCIQGTSPVRAYRWLLGEHETNEAAPSFTFGPGRHHVSLLVVDAQGLTSTDALWVTVTSGGAEPPTCEGSSSPLWGEAPLTARLAGTYKDIDGDIVRAEWTFDDGTTHAAARVDRTFPTPGYYSSTLRVEDSQGLACSHRIETSVLGGPTSLPPRLLVTPGAEATCGEAFEVPVSVGGEGPFTWSSWSDSAGERVEVDAAAQLVRWVPLPGRPVGRLQVRVESPAGSDERAWDIPVECTPTALRVDCGCAGSPAGLSWLTLAGLTVWLTVRRGGRRRRKPMAVDAPERPPPCGIQPTVSDS